MALFDDSQELQNPPMVLDALFCEEEGFEEDLGENEEEEIAKKPHPLVLLENDLFWEDDELGNLIAKEERAWFDFDGGDLSSDGTLMAARKEAVHWFYTVKAHYGFSALTTVLAVNYFDRFVSSLQFQRDKPWMSQLAAVACLSLAAKVEETHVPLLLDLQVCVFFCIACFAHHLFVKMSHWYFGGGFFLFCFLLFFLGFVFNSWTFFLVFQVRVFL